MKIALDYDGVISANFQHYAQLASDFIKSGHKVYILSACNYERKLEVSQLLAIFGVPYSEFISRPQDFISTPRTIGLWKKKMLKKFHIDLWFDNEIKIYEQAGVSFKNIKTTIVRI